MIALVWAGIAVHLNGEEKDIVGAAKQNADNLTRVFAAHVVRVVDDADRVLLSLRAEYAKDPQHFDIENAQVYLSDLILQLSVIGPDGVLKAATIEPSSGLRVDLSDRDHYRAHVNADKDDLFISKPVLGRNSGRTSIQLSRRISNPDGSFGGVIVASIDQSRLAHFYDSIDIGKDGNIAVLGSGRNFARRARLPEWRTERLFPRLAAIREIAGKSHRFFLFSRCCRWHQAARVLSQDREVSADRRRRPRRNMKSSALTGASAPNTLSLQRH